MTAPDWRQGTWACLDVETTGLTDTDRICEIAVVTMREGAVVDAWSSLVNPGIPIPAEATAVHGITDAMVAGAPRLVDLAGEIAKRILAASVVVAYNGYVADFPWLARELVGILDAVPQIDPLPIVRSAHVGQRWKGDYQPPHECPICDEDKPEPSRTAPRKSSGRHRLSRAAAILECDHPEPGFESLLHRAAWDALLCGRVLWKVCKWCSHDARGCESRLREEGARQVAELETWMASKRAEDEGRRRRRKQSLAYRIKQLEAELAELRAQRGAA